MEDAEIISLYFARNERAISETAAKYGRMCTRLAERIVGSAEDAEECVSDVWLTVWNRIPPEHPKVFPAYLVSLVRNAALNLHEKLYAQKRGGGRTAVALDELAECLPSGQDVEKEVTEAETGEMLRRFVRKLPEETRNIFILRYFYMLSVREIADRLHIGVSKVKVTLHRTRKALRNEMGGE